MFQNNLELFYPHIQLRFFKVTQLDKDINLLCSFIIHIQGNFIIKYSLIKDNTENHDL